ncbi:MAG: glycosyltransferase family 9 protein, partial [bacterium]|nr:glycosyltransferase family 9 protein [bacterium]
MNKKITVLKKLDAVIGPLAITLVKTLFNPGIKDYGPPSSFLFIRPGGIGDAVLLIPALKELKKAFPKARIDLLCEKRNHEIFELCPEIDSIFLYDSLTGLTSAIGGRYDVVIDSEQWYRLSAVIAYLTRAPIRIGFSTNDRRKLFSAALIYKEDEHEIYNFFRLISPLVPDLTFNEETAFISIPSELSNRIKPHIIKASSKKLVAIFPGGSVPEKRWPPERFR